MNTTRSSPLPPSYASSSNIEDDRRGVGKRSRRELAAEYTRRYTTEILDPRRPHADRVGAVD